MASKKRTQRKKLSPMQVVKGLIIRARLARKVKERDGKVAFQLLWTRVAVVMVTLMIAGWFSLAAGAYIFVKYKRAFPEVRYTDLLLPNRWDDYRTARGDYYIAEAKRKMEAGERDNVLHLIRVGVQQSPDNTEGRLMLAQIYNMFRRPDLGIALLQDRAMEHADDKDYINALITLLFNNHQDQTVDELVTRILDGSKEITERNLILALAGATANYNRGDLDRAEQFIDDFGLLNARSGTILQARIDWDRGQTESAIARLEKVARSPGAQQEEAFRFLTDYLWISGQKDKALRTALVRFASDPLTHSPRIRLLYIYNSMEDHAKRDQEAETYLRLFADEEPAIQELADFAGQAKTPALAERIYEHARSQGMATENPALRLIEARAGSGDHAGALAFYEQIERESREWSLVHTGRLQALLTSACIGVGNTERGDGLMRELLAQGHAGTGELLKLAQRLIGLGDHARGREVLQHVHNANPLNQEALGRLVRLDIETGNNRDIVRNLNRLLKMRRPPQVVLLEAQRHISSDLFLFERGRSEILSTLEAALASAPVRASASLQGS